jgi:transmembrane sensor
VIREALSAEKLEQMNAGEAAALLIARRSEGLTAGEQRLLLEWLSRDEAHQLAFQKAEQAWQLFNNVDSDEILTAMRAHSRAPRARALSRWWPAAAAAALILVALPVLIMRHWGAESSGTNLQANAEYISTIGEVKELQLPDGSHMTLDADSSAVLAFTAESRRVALNEGRALFAVSPDVARPFVVSAGGRSIVAVGTQFDVNLLENGLSVTLLEGRVDIASLDGARALVTLTPGQQYFERAGVATVRTIGAVTSNVTAWPRGLINFDDQPLTEAAAIMNRYSTDQIVVGPDMQSIRVSGQFRAGDSQRFAATVAELHRLGVVRQGDRIKLVRDK